MCTHGTMYPRNDPNRPLNIEYLGAQHIHMHISIFVVHHAKVNQYQFITSLRQQMNARKTSIVSTRMGW